MPEPEKTRALQAGPPSPRLREAKDRRFEAGQIPRFLGIWLVLTKKHKVFAHVGEEVKILEFSLFPYAPRLREEHFLFLRAADKYR